MAAITPSITVEQKVVTVANNDTDINASITTEAADDWLVTLLCVSGSDMVILYSRNITAVA